MKFNGKFKGHTVVVLRMMSMSSRSSGMTSSIRRGTVGTTGGGAIKAAFLALNRNLKYKITAYNIHLQLREGSAESFQAQITASYAHILWLSFNQMLK